MCDECRVQASAYSKCCKFPKLMYAVSTENRTCGLDWAIVINMTEDAPASDYTKLGYTKTDVFIQEGRGPSCLLFFSPHFVSFFLGVGMQLARVCVMTFDRTQLQV